MKNYSTQIKTRCAEKINKANKIKEQFMKIRSECENCHCYDHIETVTENSGHRDIKYQTMKTGSAWRVSENRNSPIEEPL